MNINQFAIHINRTKWNENDIHITFIDKNNNFEFIVIKVNV